MNKWRLLLLSIFALLHITTSERVFIDGRHGCYDHSPRYLPSDTRHIVYETNRERRFSPQIRQLNPPDKYAIYNARNIEIIRLSRQRQINSIKRASLDIPQIDGLQRNRILTNSADLVGDNVRNTGTFRLSKQRQISLIKQRSLDNESRQINGVRRNRILTTTADQVEDKKEDRGRNFLKSIYKRSNDLRTITGLRHNRSAGDQDTEYQRRGQTTSLSRDNYRINYATTTRFNNRYVSQNNNNNRDMRNTQNDNRVEARPIVSEDNELNTRRYVNRNDIRNSFGYVRYIETYEYPRKYASERVVREEPDLRDLRTIRSERTNNKLSNDRKSKFGIQRDLYQNLSQRVSRNGRRNNGRSLDRVDFRENERRFLSDSQTNRRSLVRDIEKLNSLNDNRKRIAGEHNRAVNLVGGATRGQILKLRETVRVPRTESNQRQSFEQLNIISERENRFRTSRSSILRDDQNNARPKKDTHEISGNRMDMNEREIIVSRFDRQNVIYDIRFTRNTNEKETSENKEVRHRAELAINRIRINSRMQMNERETLDSRVDRRNVNYNTRFTRNTNEKETSENREVRDNAELKINRVRMSSRITLKEREPLLSRVDKRNVNYDTRLTRNANEKETPESREVRDNAEHTINRIRMNSRMQMNERETSDSRVDRRNVNYNTRFTRNTNEKETSESREVRDNAELTINRIRKNSRMQMNERETSDSRVDRRNVNYNTRFTRNTNEKEPSENREVSHKAELAINRIRMNSRMPMNERETSDSRVDRRNVNYNTRFTRNTNEKEPSENREVRDNAELKINRVRMSSRITLKEREPLLSRVDKRNVNYDTRLTRNANEKETPESREVRDNAEHTINRIRMNSRMPMNERETSDSRVDRRNVNYNTRFTRNTNEKEPSENREVRDNAELKINRVRMSSRITLKEREPLLSRVDKRNVNYDTRLTRNANEKETPESREVRDNAEHTINRIRMNSRMQMNERETSDSRVDRRNVNYNTRFTRNTNEKEPSENREVRHKAELAINRIRMNSRMQMNERETSDSRVDRRNVNYNTRFTRNTNDKEPSENREVRDNAELKINRVRMSSRITLKEREPLLSRVDKINVNYDTRLTRNANEKETPESREVRDDLALKVNSINIYPRMELNTRATRRINRKMIIIRRSTVQRDLDKRIVRRNVPIEELRVSELRQSERINDETNGLLKRTREALILSTGNRERHESRPNLRESRYVRSREYRIVDIELGNRQRSGRHEASTDKLHINNIERSIENRLSAQQDENRITSRNSININNIVRGSVETSRRTVEDDNRQWSRNAIANRLSNKRHETRIARDEKRQRKISREDTSIGIRRRAMARVEDKERPVSLHYENYVMEMKWQYLFYALQAVYLCSVIMKISKYNELTKSKMWIASWFTLTEHVKFD